MQELAGKTKTIKLNSIDSIIGSLLNERGKIDEQVKQFKELSRLIPESPMSNKAASIRYISGTLIEQFLKERTPLWEASMRKNRDLVWRGIQDGIFPELYGEWVKWYWKRAPKGFKTELISGALVGDKHKELDRMLKDSRELRSWKPLAKLTGTVWVHGDYIVFFMLRKKPHYLIEIQDADLAYNLRILFKTLWNISS